MAIEIERKFLVKHTDWLEHHSGTAYKQGYVVNSEGTTVRVRIAGDRGILTIKGGAVGLRRPEFEYEIPLEDAEEMLILLCAEPKIEKTRYKIPVGTHVWDVDIFHGDNDGLIVAEVELSSPNEAFEKPDWLAEEVTGDARYFNAQLIRNPFKDWT